MRVIGVDGVRERWLAAVLHLDPAGGRPARVSWRLGSAVEVLSPLRGHGSSPWSRPGDPDGAEPAGEDRSEVVAAGVDVPLGLVEHGSRPAEAEARRLLGRAASSVFTTAPAAAFRVARGGPAAGRAPTMASRPAADQASRAAGGGGVPAQSWMIAGKVLQVEDAVRGLGAAGERVVEVHPETSFAVMARHFGVPAPAAKRSAPGVAQRIDLLGRTLPGLDVVAALAGVPAGASAAERVPVDDALDALAAACSALRHAYGQALVLGAGRPPPPAVWSDGTPAPGRAVIVV